MAALLAACTTAPKPPVERGTPPQVPADVSKMPDATPQVEPVREGGPNKPYALGGRSYTPQTGDKPFAEQGIASWYGKPFHGRRTASGEVYNMFAMTAAHKTMPLPSYARVRNPANSREVIVRVNDRGPFHKGRVIDLSYAAAMKLGVTDGLAKVEVERITFEDIRTGAWKRDSEAVAAAVAVPAESARPVAAEQVVAAEAGSTGGAAATPVSPSADMAGETVAANTARNGAAPDSPPVASSRALTSGARGFWVQLGAFKQRMGAEQLQRQATDELGWLAPLLAVFGEAQMFRLQAGPYPSKAEAQGAADRIRESLKLAPLVVERR